MKVIQGVGHRLIRLTLFDRSITWGRKRVGGIIKGRKVDGLVKVLGK